MPAYLTPRPDMIQVTYQVLSDKLLDPEKKARLMAEAHRGQVLGVDERTHVEGQPYEYVLTLGFPPENTEGDIPSLLTLLFGKISMDRTSRLQHIEFPDTFLRDKGPRFGIPGIRKLLGEKEKPLTLAILKPCLGLTPIELATLFTPLAMGGMHIVRDDEILPDLPLCSADKRLEACLKAADQAFLATKRRTLYALNLTGKPSEIPGKARRLAKAGAQCFLFNVLSYGYGVLEELRDVGVPIMAHPALSGALCGSAVTALSYSVILGSLMRLGGADLVIFPSSYGSLSLPKKETDAIQRALSQPMGDLKQVFPVPSAGIRPGLIPKILADYGKDVVVNAGASIYAHPQGPRAGAKAFRQALSWLATHKDFSSLSVHLYPELTAALKLWGR